MTTNAEPSNDSQIPDMAFQLFKKGLGNGASRLGRLSLTQRKPIETPNYIATTSRGTIPHITPDNISKHVSFGGAYMALEDFVERKDPPVYKTPGTRGRPLHEFTGFPQDLVTVMGPRRTTPVTTAQGNGAKYLSLWTSYGTATMTIDAYISAVEATRPDIAIAPGDLLHTSKTPPSKKLLRMSERTEEWNIKFLAPSQMEKFQSQGISVFAPVLAVPRSIQWEYLEHLVASHQGTHGLTGLTIHDTAILPDLTENYQSLEPLARLSLDAPASPLEIVRQIEAGIDICTVPFLDTTSDAGVAFTFTFPPPMQEPGQPAAPLGRDMWASDNVTSMSPLMEGCQCYACTKHHSAFVHHLLNAKEMLGWTLLQIHNHQVMSDFFAGIRSVLRDTPDEFAGHVERFEASYEGELPKGTGSRPRARGYHFKSAAGQDKINATQWEDYGKDENGAVADQAAGHARDDTDTPLVPDADAQKLDVKGFAEKTNP